MRKNRKIVITFIIAMALIAVTVIVVATINNKQEDSGISQNEKTEIIPLPESESNPTEITEMKSL